MTPPLSHHLLRLIDDLGLSPGDRLPPERDLAQKFRVSRGSIREAVKHLAAQGVVESRRGAGTFVVSSPQAFTRAMGAALAGAEVSGRGDRIRTCDPHTPSVMRYQAALRPDRRRLVHKTTSGADSWGGPLRQGG